MRGTGRLLVWRLAAVLFACWAQACDVPRARSWCGPCVLMAAELEKARREADTRCLALHAPDLATWCASGGRGAWRRCAYRQDRHRGRARAILAVAGAHCEALRGRQLGRVFRQLGRNADTHTFLPTPADSRLADARVRACSEGQACAGAHTPLRARAAAEASTRTVPLQPLTATSAVAARRGPVARCDGQEDHRGRVQLIEAGVNCTHSRLRSFWRNWFFLHRRTLPLVC